jgi:hypothetical protein
MGYFANKGRYDESTSSNNSGFIDWGKAGVQKDDFYKPPKNGTVLIDIVPFFIKSENHPLVRRKKAKIGDLDYVLDIWVHRNVGPGEVDVVCPKRNYGLACPVCDFSEERSQTNGTKDEEYLASRAKRRVIYNVLDVQNESGLKVFDVSHFLFEKELIEESKHEGEVQGYSWLDFADPEEGCTIECRTSAEKFGQFETIKFKNFKFREREAGIITEKLMKKAVSFDEFLIVYSEEQINEIMYGDGKVEAEEKDTDSRPGRSIPTITDDDEDEIPVRRRKAVESDDEEETVPRRKKPVVETVEEDTKDEEEPAPVKRTKPEAKKKSRTVEEEGEMTCPFDHKFGVDADEFDDCDECQIWKECMKAKNRNK